MVSARGLIHQTRNTLDLLKTCPEDSPLIVQLYGSEPEVINKSMSILLDLGFCFFDLNCGCSVKKVIKTGSGAALLKNPDLIVEMALAMSEAAGPGRSGIKIRLGWSSEDSVYLELAERLSGSGMGWITLHPRTAVQLFSGKARWDALKIIKKVTSIPIIASGDLFTAGLALECVRQTNVDNVMFARGALNNPSIFQQYINLRKEYSSHESGLTVLEGRARPGTCLQARQAVPSRNQAVRLLPSERLQPDNSYLRDMCLKTIDFYKRYYPSQRAMLKMRTVIPRMIREIQGAKELRKEIITCKDWDDIKQAVEKIC